MSGLVLSLKPNEKFLVNGALLTNGSKRGQIRITGDDVNILRLSDALHPDEVLTPVRRVYYSAQLFLSGDAQKSEDIAQIEEGLDSLLHVFENTPLLSYVEKARAAVSKKRYYSVLVSLKPLLLLEADLLSIPAPSIVKSVVPYEMQKKAVKELASVAEKHSVATVQPPVQKAMAVGA